MESLAKNSLFKSEQNTLLVAAAIAVIFHIALMTTLRIDTPLVSTPSLDSIRIMLAKEDSQPVSEPEYSEVVEQIKEPPRIEPVEEQPPSETFQDAPPLVTTSDILEPFLNNETERTLQQRPEDLEAFAQSFKETGATRQGRTLATTNIYGETMVRTRIGNKDVCYLENNQFVDDDWGFNLVMFYACRESERSKPKISLE